MPAKKTPGPKKGQRKNRKAGVLQALAVLLAAGVLSQAQFLRAVKKL